jgi:hypothetical protein
MNFTITPLNNTLINYSIPVYDCVDYMSKTLDTDCVLRTYCPQLSSHIVNLGIIIIILIVALTWLKWWYLNHGYEKYMPNLTYEQRIKINNFIMDKLLKFCVGYIVMVVYMSIS